MISSADCSGSSVDLPFQHVVLLDFHSERFVRAQRFLRPWIHFVHRTLQRERICNGFGWHGVHDNWPCCSLNVKSCRGPNRCGEHQSRAGELASQVKEFCPRAWATLSESPGALSDQLLRLPVNYAYFHVIISISCFLGRSTAADENACTVPHVMMMHDICNICNYLHSQSCINILK